MTPPEARRPRFDLRFRDAWDAFVVVNQSFSDAVLEQFGVRLIAPLGGRLNLHWLVEARRERLVLRRWAQPAAVTLLCL